MGYKNSMQAQNKGCIDVRSDVLTLVLTPVIGVRVTFGALVTCTQITALVDIGGNFRIGLAVMVSPVANQGFQGAQKHI